MAHQPPSPPGHPARLNVNGAPATRRAIHQVAVREGATTTESFRRLISYGYLLYTATRWDGADLLIRRDGQVERILLAH